jgi:hypothetical protein
MRTGIRPVLISALLCWSDLNSLIGVDLPACAATFAPSLLSDPPRVFNSSRAPTLNTGRPGVSSAPSAMPSAPPPGSFGSSGAKAASAPGTSAAAFAAPPTAAADSTAAAASAAATASTAAAASAAAASAAATSATSAAVSVRAVKIYARLIELASDTRSRSCASQHLRKGSPGSAS